MDKFDQMVEAIEEAEDMVECKECFDLFPKAECTKMDHGYLCPTCGREKPQDFSDVSFTDITTDLYDQEFPDVREYDSEFGPEMDERQKDYNVDDIVDALVKDEYDAIDSYEFADEAIQHAEGDEEIKDDLLDAIEHIKEEEEEHIAEINDAAGRVEADLEDKDEDKKEDEEDDKKSDESDDEEDKDDDKDEDDKKDESLTESEATEPTPEMVEGEDLLEKKEDSVFNKIWKPVNESYTWTCVYDGKEIGTVEAETEEEAAEKMQTEYPEYHYGAYDGCFEVIQEDTCKVNKGINHTEDEQEVLNEEVEDLEEGIFDGRFGKTLDGFYKNGYVVYIRLPKDATEPAGFQSQIKATSFDAARKLAKQYATKYAASKANVFVLPLKLTQADYDALDPATKAFAPNPAGGEKPPVLAKFFAGGKEDTSLNRVKEIAKGLSKIAKADKKINKITGQEAAADEAADVASEADTDVAEPETVDAEVETEAEADAGAGEDAPAAEATPKKTEANRKIKNALKAAGWSKADISNNFKTIALVRKALIGEGLELRDLEEGWDEEETVECAWCNRRVPRSECHKEVDMGWLCDGCERAINSRGETLTFEEKLDIDLSNCVDSSDIEVYGLEHAGDNLYKAVLAKRYENVNLNSFDEEQAIVDEMYEDGNVFEFTFAKDGTPCLGAWNVNVLHELGPCDIIFEDERYDQAANSAMNS